MVAYLLAITIHKAVALKSTHQPDELARRKFFDLRFFFLGWQLHFFDPLLASEEAHPCMPRNPFKHSMSSDLGILLALPDGGKKLSVLLSGVPILLPLSW